MAFSDGYVRATCDKCGDEEEITLAWMYFSYNEASGHYSLRETIDRMNGNGWIVTEKGEHCLCPGCGASLDNHSPDCDCEDCDERNGLVEYEANGAAE